MSRILNKLIRLAQEEHRPVFIYDRIRDEATVLMDLESYERGSFGLCNFQNSKENDDEVESFDDAFGENEENIDEFVLDDVKSEPNLESLEKLEEYIHDCVTDTSEKLNRDEESFIDQTNRDLALYQVKREEKEREEIARVLEEELQADPLPDPFEEDFIRPSQWHEISDMTELFPPLEAEDHKTAEVEPSYHPIAESKIFGIPMNWSTWDEASRNAKPIPSIAKANLDFPKNEAKSQPESLSEDPIFLEEPLS